MNLYTAILAAALLVPGAALAQATSSSQQSNGMSNQTYSQQSNNQNSTSGQNGYGQNSAQNQTAYRTGNGQNSMNNQQQSTSGQEQTLQGCVTRQETDYFITPVNGTPVRLRGNQDLSSAENRNATVTGRYENGSASSTAEGTSKAGEPATAATPSPTYGTYQGPASSQSGQSPNANTSSNGTTQTSQWNNQNSGSQNSTMSSQSNSNSNQRDFLVTRVDTVSSNCPANNQGSGMQH